MSAERFSLLDAADLAEQGAPAAVALPLDLIDQHPDNPRQRLTEVPELAESIRDFGLLQPILVRRVGERYQLLAGHRRTAAMHLLHESYPHDPQYECVDAHIIKADDERAYMALLSAQLHTSNWRPREEAAALERLVTAGMNLKQVGSALHRSEAWASKRLRVYSDSVLSGYVQSGALPSGHAEELLRVRDLAVRKELAEQARQEQWSQSQTRAAIVRIQRSSALREIAKRARELLDLLSSIDAARIPIEAARDLWTLHGRIEVMGRGAESVPGAKPRQPKIPTIEAAQRAAGVKTQERKLRPGEKRKPGLKFRTPA